MPTMMIMRLGNLIAVLIVLVGCRGRDEFAELFEEAPRPTTTLLYGTWAGTIDGLDQRWVIEPNRMTIANRCDNRIVGVVAAARIRSTELEILETKDAGTKQCHAGSMAGTLYACSEKPARPCFEHAGKRLTLRASDERSFELVKIAD